MFVISLHIALLEEMPVLLFQAVKIVDEVAVLHDTKRFHQCAEFLPADALRTVGEVASHDSLLMEEAHLDRHRTEHLSDSAIVAAPSVDSDAFDAKLGFLQLTQPLADMFYTFRSDLAKPDDAPRIVET